MSTNRPTLALGIAGMRKRVRRVGGKVHVSPWGRRGTVVTATLPVPVECIIASKTVDYRLVIVKPAVPDDVGVGVESGVGPPGADHVVVIDGRPRDLELVLPLTLVDGLADRLIGVHHADA